MTPSNVRLAALTLALLALTGNGCGPRGTPGVPYDLQFIDAMSLHHKGALDMARPAESLALHPELREFARRVVDDQSREVAQMTAWRDRWYPGRPPVATVMAMPGMERSMAAADTGHFRSLAGNAYDLMWVEMMISHHEGAVAMAQEAAQKAEHEEVRQLAQAIVEAQQAEIAMMRDWHADWTGPK